MLLYHYCSNDTFLSILRNSELWLSELTLSNDSMEGIWVREVLLEECRERNLSPQALDDFAEKTTSLLEFLSAAGFCLSAEGDLLSQWRGYADNGAGIAVGFDRNDLKALCDGTKEEVIGPTLGKVIYESPKQRAAIRPHADRLEKFINKGILTDIAILPERRSNEEDEIGRELKTHYNFQFLRMMDVLFIIKNKAFSEENEWRILRLLIKADFENNTLKGGPYRDPQNLDFRARGDHIVPYLRLPIPDDKKGCIKEIILGPRNRTPEPVIRAVLEKYGFENVNIRRSAATYR